MDDDAVGLDQVGLIGVDEAKHRPTLLTSTVSSVKGNKCGFASRHGKLLRDTSVQKSLAQTGFAQW
jgi:hypothetical protein